ncbi:YSIRK-type signal peptide-containing protein, partial [Enterococcus faecalis]|uniref:YSIRK-type signal peptide-containing protein n=1 Tax=Enterococcus faecalis TaxID=1351 RepID=UPI001D18F901
MFSKNNKNMYLKKMENRILKFSIKKLNVGVASVLVGVGIMFGSSQIVSASEVDSTLITMSKTIEESNEEIEQDKGQTLEEATAKASDSVNVLVDESLTEESNEEIEQDKGQTLEEATAKASDSVNVLVDESLTEESNEEIEQDKGQTLEEATAKASDSVSENVLVDGKIKENNKRKVDIGITEVKEGATLANKDISRVRAKRSFSMENTDKQKETEINVSEWSSLIQALSDNQYSIINVSGLINATGNDIITGDGRNVTVRGIQGSTINFNNNIIKAQGTNWNLVFDNLNISTGNSKGTVDFIATNGHNTITFKDINASGTSLYGGGGDTTVIIDGTTTSTVDNASIGKTNSYTSTSREANIHSTKELIVNDGASFTLNRSSIGDGINLPDGATVRVGNNAVFNVNMNTKNGKESARYHNAGIFMLNGGTFITGRKSVVNMHTSIGQAVSIGVKRPSDSVTDKDRFGGYTSKQSRNEGVTVVTLGNQSIFNFIGRDGFILGNNATFTSGEYSKVHFKNKGRGVALDLANNSDIIISKHSNTFFESDGKTGNPPSGSYDGYNYIGVNEGGNITIDEYATFRVILKNRGDNAWDDVITLDSRKPGTSAAFVSKKGAVVDIRDDNTNFYAELISFPLGEANSKIDIQSPLYLNLQRYSSDGSTAGWMSVGGVSINTTSNAYTANLIYMGGSKGTLRIGGTDYVVYQQIKSNGSKQIWLNVQDVTFKKNGFANIPKNNNGANPDLSISGNDLVAGIEANRVKEDPTDPTKGNNAPYYGISSMRANHQIWFPHSTSNQASGLHKNVIRYIYEDGTPILDNIGQPLVVKQETDWVREFVLSIPDEKLRKVQEYGATHTADEILEYVKNLYTVSEDSGWRLDNTVNTHDAYDAVNSPELEGYTAKIKSSNVNGLSVGDIATVVKVNLNLPDTIVNKGQLSEEYKQNGITGIPEDYETV